MTITIILTRTGRLPPLAPHATATDARKALTVTEVPEGVPLTTVVLRAGTLGLLPYGPWTLAYAAMTPGRLLHGTRDGR